MAKKINKITVPKNTKNNEIQVKTHTTMKNSVNMLGSQILEVLEKNGIIFAIDSKVTIKSNKRSRWTPAKSISINPKEMYC